MIVFPKNKIREVYAQAVQEYPTECCGVLLGVRKGKERCVVEVVPVGNAAEDNRKHAHFSINPLEFVRIEESAVEKGLEIVGFYHSHPDCGAQASDEDIAYMILGYSYLILSVIKGKCESVESYEKTSYDEVFIQKEMIRTEEG